MSTKKLQSTAESVDNKFRLMALAMFLYSLGTACDAIKITLNEPLAGYFDKLELVFVFFAFLIGLHLLWWKLRRVPKNQRHMFSDPEGFVAQVIKKSCSVSWAWTFVVLMFMSPLTKKIGADLPSEFFLKVVLFMMLGIFSGTFFFLFRTLGEDELE